MPDILTLIKRGFYFLTRISIFAFCMPFIRRPITYLALLFCFTATADAQKLGLALDLTFHKGIQTKNRNDAPFQSTRSYSLGSGISRQLTVNFYPDSSNWYFGTGIQYFNGMGIISASAASGVQGQDNLQLLSLSSLRWNNRLTYTFHLKRFDIGISGGFVLPLTNRLIEKMSLYDSGFNSISEARLKNYTSIGFSGGFGISARLNNKIRLFCNGDVCLLNSKVKSRILMSYSDSKGVKMEEQFPATAYRETIYHTDPNLVRNNETVLKNSFNKDLPTDKLTYLSSYSSVGIQIGLLFLF